MLHHGALLSSESNDFRFSCIDYTGDLIAVGNARGAIFFYKVISKATRLRPELTLHVAPPPNDKSLNVTLTCIRFSPCQTYLAVGSASGTVLVFNLKDRSRLDIKSSHDDHRGKAISALCWSYDSSKLFSGCVGGVVIEFIFSENASDWNSSSSSTSAMALNFASALLMGKRSTTLICQCDEIIRQIECAFSDTCSCGSADVLLVSVAHHSLLFQLPINKNQGPRFCDIPIHTHMKAPDEPNIEEIKGENHFDNLWCASTFYYSNTSTGTNNRPQIQATFIIVAQSCESGIQLVYSTLDGEVQETFQLKGPFRARTDDGYGWESCCLGVRCLGTFNSNMHKHLLTLVTADNSVMLINLQDMSCDYLLDHFDYSIHAAVPNNGKLLILYENILQEMMMTDLLEVVTPTSAAPPLKIFDSHLYLSVTYMKRCWLLRKMESERERERDMERDSNHLGLLSSSSDISNHSNIDYDNGNAFLYFEPGDNTENDLISSVVICGDYENKQYNRTNTKRNLLRHSDNDSVRDLDTGKWKKLDDLENDLNHALSACDEELEAWAFNAAAATTGLSSLLAGGGGGETGGQSGRISNGHSNSHSSSHLELGGGGGGPRSLDEIAKYGAILSTQGVCLSAEAITQLSSLQQVLTNGDHWEGSPRQQALVGSGYDYYGLDDEDQKKRQAVVVANRARIKERKNTLKNILAESYDTEDSIGVYRNSQTFCQFQNSNCSNIPRSGSVGSRDLLFGAVQERGRNSIISSNTSSVNSSTYSLKSLLPSNSSDKLLSGYSIDAADHKFLPMTDDMIPAIERKISLINRIDKALKNTSKVLNLKIIDPPDGIEVEEENINGTSLGYMKPIIYSCNDNFDRPFWLTLENADEIIYSESLECSGSKSSPCNPSKHRFADRIRRSCSCIMRAATANSTSPCHSTLPSPTPLLSSVSAPQLVLSSSATAALSHTTPPPIPTPTIPVTSCLNTSIASIDDYIAVRSPIPTPFGLTQHTNNVVQVTEKKEMNRNEKKAITSYSSSNGIGSVSNSRSFSVTFGVLDELVSEDELTLLSPHSSSNAQKYPIKSLPSDQKLIPNPLTTPAAPVSSFSPPLLLPSEDILSFVNFATPLEISSSPSVPSHSESHLSASSSSSSSSPTVPSHSESHLSASSSSSSPTVPSHSEPLLSASSSSSSPPSPHMASMELTNIIPLTMRYSAESTISEEIDVKFSDSDKGIEEEDFSINPFTDSDISWMEWWWDLDRTDDKDILTHPSMEGISEVEEQLQVDPRSPRHSDVTLIPESDPKSIPTFHPESTPGIALKRRIAAARKERQLLMKSNIIENKNLLTSQDADSIISKTVKKNQNYNEFNNPKTKKLKKIIRKVVQNIEIVESLYSLRQEEAPRNMYDVMVIAPKGLGLNLSLLSDGALMVRTFSTLENNDLGPVEKSGFVRVGDYLIGINGLSLIGLGLEQIAEILQNLDKMGEVSHIVQY